MKPEEYWARRMDQLNEAMLSRGEDYIRTQREEYERALAKSVRRPNAGMRGWLKTTTSAWRPPVNCSTKTN
ncbi:hypothetical protein PACILC2_21890 [Paenibacillus cisolokensis]|uniref:Uncharacterized protein n=1 Tax=Paenibacillus cisolokensis TaxID=1658519 RepID=A0ABQ4N640_9BACL|nr:hypothetical protein [Paenibacillus cisolokensis]GIQ63621.1 hypothetical protein PACILC2_21890 [Paenibacillus cisolokensis]